VQYKDDLSQPNWNDASIGVVINGSTVSYVDSSAGLASQRFYRVALVEKRPRTADRRALHPQKLAVTLLILAYIQGGCWELG